MTEYSDEEIIYWTHLYITFFIVTFILGPIQGRIRRDEMKAQDWVGLPLALAHGLIAFIMHMIL